MANLKDTIIAGVLRVTGTIYGNLIGKVDGKTVASKVEYILGTQSTSAATGTWLGVSTDNELYDGKEIIYTLPVAGSGNATLNLTLSDGTTTGAKNVYAWGTTRFTTHFGVNTPFRLTYHKSITINGTAYEGWWHHGDYNTNSNTWRNITVGGTAWKSTGTGTGALNFVQGSGIALTASGNDLTIAADAGNAKVFYGTCSTAASTAAKVCVCTDFTSTDLVVGATIHVLFDSANTAASPTLNVNSTGAKSILPNNDIGKRWYGGTVVTFTYNGTGWVNNTSNLTLGNGGSISVSLNSSGNSWLIKVNPTTATASLTVAGWSNNSQTVTVSGVTTSNHVIISPAAASASDYAAAGIVCTTQASNSLTFTCVTVPTAAITVNVMILG